MESSFVMYAKYNKRANTSVFELLAALSEKDLNEDRKSYFGSLSNMIAHIVGSALYFHSLFRQAPSAVALLADTEKLSAKQNGPLSGPELKEMAEVCKKLDEASINLVSKLNSAEINSLIAVDWFGGKPGKVPMGYLLHSFFTHGTHHRGQISQVLDEMGIEHNFSGIDIDFYPGLGL